MEREGHDGLPTIIADMENLRQQLKELHAAAKTNSTGRREQDNPATAVGMVIKGK